MNKRGKKWVEEKCSMKLSRYEEVEVKGGSVVR
jgi:hypothetical protein